MFDRHLKAKTEAMGGAVCVFGHIIPNDCTSKNVARGVDLT